MSRSWLRPACLCLSTVLTISSCADKTPSGPTVTEAEKDLRSHITALTGPGIGNVRNLKVVDPGGKDLPCGKGKARRTYAVTGDKNDPAMDDLSLTPVELSNAMFGRLISHVAKYELTTPQGGKSQKSMHNWTTRTNLSLSVEARRVIVIRGSTDCLRIS